MLTHLNEQGEANMVDVGAKDVTVRTAKAAGRIRMQKETRRALLNASLKKATALPRQGLPASGVQSGRGSWFRCATTSRLTRWT